MPTGSRAPSPGSEDATMPSARPSGAGDDPADHTMPDARSAPPPPPKAKAAADALVGQTLGGCRIDKLLGRGAMGAVYKARQLKLDRDVAVKVIRAEMMTDPRMLKRFEVEARTVGKFNSANVVMVHDVGFERGVHYLVMEFVLGQNLREHVKLLAGGRLPAGEALPLLRQACKGLDEARRLGVIHRDIKPDNLMLTEQGVLKIADFGIAKPVHEDFSMTLTSELIGTPLYMSPEQCQGGAELDFRSDMYSLGATFYYLLTGEPPVRASSVYELIQTKTKLENLCLWKALPELDENHPLSRVIERMTALDREDRYDSYEALLNDLVLVEQGGTVVVPKRDPAKPRARTAVAASKPRAAHKLWLLAAVLLAAGGGGYAWSRLETPAPLPPPGPGPGPGPAVVDAGTDTEAQARLQRAQKQLETFRKRLLDDGPSDTLRMDIEDAGLPASLHGEQQRLAGEVAAGMAIVQALAAIPRPGAPALPFDDLLQHFAAVAAAAPLQPAASGELRQWRDRVVSAAEAKDELGPKALATLVGAVTSLQASLPDIGDDDKRRLEADATLNGIVTARQRLVDHFPSLRAQIEQDLAATLLEQLRLRLKAGPGAVVDVDIGTALQEIRDEFARVGPNESLRDRAEKLRPSRPDQLDARNALLDDIQAAAAARSNAQLVATGLPRPPKAPFDDVDGFFGRLDLALKPLRDAQGALPGWAEALRTSLRAEPELQQGVVAVYRQLNDGWQQQRAGGAAPAALASGLAALRAARAAAVRLFPAAADELAAVMSEADLTAADQHVEQVAARGACHADLEALTKRVTAVGGLAAWRAGAAGLQQEQAALAGRVAAFAGDSELTARLDQAKAAIDGWRDADTRFTALAKLAGAGELSQAAAAVPASSSVAEMEALGKAVAACQAAFAAIDKHLDLVAAQQQLESAGTHLQPLAALAPAFGAKVQAWAKQLAEVKRAAVGMVVIPAGETVEPRESVPAFFLAATECSRAEFGRFLTELKQATAGVTDTKARFDAVAGRFAGAEMTADRLRELLQRDAGDDQMPVDRVSWFAAAACAAWQGRALPSAAEWALAAFGDGKKYEFPWGDRWSVDAKDRNPSNVKAAEVDDGGLSWRQQQGVRLHHLAGNVAEWLAAEPAAKTAMAAGGRFNLRGEREAKEQAGGRPATFYKDENLAGVGFRTVLRPRAAFGADWPR